MQTIKSILKNPNFYIFLFLTVITLAAASGLEESGLYLWLEDLVRSYLFVFLILIIILKIIGVIWPPFTGIVFTGLAVPIVGWVGRFRLD